MPSNLPQTGAPSYCAPRPLLLCHRRPATTNDTVAYQTLLPAPLPQISSTATTSDTLADLKCMLTHLRKAKMASKQHSVYEESNYRHHHTSISLMTRMQRFYPSHDEHDGRPDTGVAMLWAEC